MEPRDGRESDQGKVNLRECLRLIFSATLAPFFACSAVKGLFAGIPLTSHIQQSSVNQEMRPGPATPIASLVVFLFSLSPLGGEMITSVRQRSPGEPLCRSRLPIRDHAITRPQPLRRPTALFLLHEQEGEEAATPGLPVRACARFRKSPGNSPSRIAGCRWLSRNHSAGSGMPTFSLNPLSARLLRSAIQKTCLLVQKLWRMRLPCGSPRKT